MNRRHAVRGDLEAAARAASRGDRDAFALLCEAVERDVWRYCWSMLGQRDLADEAAQETFARAVRSIRRFRGDGPVKAWFCVIARRVCIDHFRRRPNIPIPIEATDANLSAPAGSVGDHVEALELLATLDPDSRHAFVLTQLVGLTYDETATICDVPIGTIRSRVFRARDALATRWAADEHESARRHQRQPTRHPSQERR